MEMARDFIVMGRKMAALIFERRSGVSAVSTEGVHVEEIGEPRIPEGHHGNGEVRLGLAHLLHRALGRESAHLRLRRLRDGRASESEHSQAEDQARGTAHADLRPAARPGNQRGDEGQTSEPEC